MTSVAAKQISTWTSNLEELRAQLAAAQAKQAEARQTRQDAALAAHLGDPAQRKALDEATEALRIAELEVESLTEALAQAEGKLAEARAEQQSERDRQLAEEMRELARKRLAACDEIERAAQALAAVVAEYGALGLRLSRMQKNPSGQLNSRWRLDAYLNHVLDLAFVKPEHRQPLSQLERSVLSRILKEPQP